MHSMPIMRAAGSLLALLMLAMTSPASAAPWAAPGDPRLRHSLQSLVDQGCLEVPVTSWPVMWTDIHRRLYDRDVSPECRNTTAWRYLRFEHERQTRPGFSGGVRLEGASDEPVFRDFSGGAREKAAAGARVEWLADGVALGLDVQQTRDPRDGDRTRLDGSYVAGALGNWVFGFGKVDRWWGPGWHSSDILSTNARPVPAFWLNRRSTAASEWPLLRWLGPWQFTVIAGELEAERAVPDTRLLGARLSFRPVDGLEIGMSRTAQWAGEGRPDSSRSLRKCLVGDSNHPVGDGEDQDACGQMAGFDLRWSFLTEPGFTPAFYAQAIGEDEAGMLPSNYMALAGLELGTALGGQEQRFFLEYTDNIAGTWPSEQRPNVAFENGSYPTGYRYRGRNMASTWETDARAGTFGASHFTADGREIGVSIIHAALNRDGTLRSSEARGLMLEPVDVQRLNIMQLRYRQPLPRGRITLSGWFKDHEIESLEHEEETRQLPRTTVMATWEYRFAL